MGRFSNIYILGLRESFFNLHFGLAFSIWDAFFGITSSIPFIMFFTQRNVVPSKCKQYPFIYNFRCFCYCGRPTLTCVATDVLSHQICHAHSSLQYSASFSSSVLSSLLSEYLSLSVVTRMWPEPPKKRLRPSLIAGADPITTLMQQSMPALSELSWATRLLIHSPNTI